MALKLDKETAKALLPVRDDRQAKWHFGRTILVCGSAAMSGAALLSAQGALRSGAGLVQLCSVAEVIAAARTAVPEALLLPVEQSVNGVISQDAISGILSQAEKAQSLLIGCGLGITDHGYRLLKSLTANYAGTVVIDADGLNVLAEHLTLLYNVPERCILTPHIGEFCRLSGLTREQVEQDVQGAAMDFAARYRCVVALKGARTVVTDGDRAYVLDCPNSGMAKGGSGDVLAGLAAGLCAQMPHKPLESAALAAYLHSRAGELAREKRSAYAMLPRDVLDALGQAFLELEG